MTPEQYQEATQKFAVYPKAFAMEYLSLGLASEAGEVAGKMSKLIRGDYTEVADAPEGERQPMRINVEDFQQNVKKELGDVLYMVSQICNEMEWSMGEVMQANIDKLSDRLKRDVIKGSGDER